MSFTVRWHPTGRGELHQVWVTAPNPAAVRAAAEAAERILANDPFGSGQHLAEGLWRAVVPPLVVYYSIDTAQRVVVISNVAHLV